MPGPPPCVLCSTFGVLACMRLEPRMTTTTQRRKYWQSIRTRARRQHSAFILLFIRVSSADRAHSRMLAMPLHQPMSELIGRAYQGTQNTLTRSSGASCRPCILQLYPGAFDKRPCDSVMNGIRGHGQHTSRAVSGGHDATVFVATAFLESPWVPPTENVRFRSPSPLPGRS